MFKKKMMEEMSWTDFKKAMETHDTALVPIGSVEVEGPHLPISVDSIVAEEVARRVADATEGTLVAPLIKVTYSSWHMGFAGTLSLRMSTLLKVTEELCSSLCHQGFKKIFFINSHIGNDPAIWNTANEFTEQGKARVGMVSLWPLCNEVGEEIPEFKEKKFMHAGEMMTSLVMAIRPDLVNMDQALVEYLKPKTDGYEVVLSSKSRVKGKMFSFYHTSEELTQSGVMGDPLAATAEKGEALLSKLVEFTSEAVSEYRRIPLPKGIY